MLVTKETATCSKQCKPKGTLHTLRGLKLNAMHITNQGMFHGPQVQSLSQMFQTENTLEEGKKRSDGLHNTDNDKHELGKRTKGFCNKIVTINLLLKHSKLLKVLRHSEHAQQSTTVRLHVGHSLTLGDLASSMEAIADQRLLDLKGMKSG